MNYSFFIYKETVHLHDNLHFYAFLYTLCTEEIYICTADNTRKSSYIFYFKLLNYQVALHFFVTMHFFANCVAARIVRYINFVGDYWRKYKKETIVVSYA